jgi:hypothetical protein
VPRLSVAEIAARVSALEAEGPSDYFKVRHPAALGGGIVEVRRQESGGYSAWLWDAYHDGFAWQPRGGCSSAPILRANLAAEMADKIVRLRRRERRAEA